MLKNNKQAVPRATVCVPLSLTVLASSLVQCTLWNNLLISFTNGNSLRRKIESDRMEEEIAHQERGRKGGFVLRITPESGLAEQTLLEVGRRGTVY